MTAASEFYRRLTELGYAQCGACRHYHAADGPHLDLTVMSADEQAWRAAAAKRKADEEQARRDAELARLAAERAAADAAKAARETRELAYEERMPEETA